MQNSEMAKKGWEKVISLDIVTRIGLNLELALVQEVFLCNIQDFSRIVENE